MDWLANLITKRITPFSGTLKKFRYEEIRAYSAVNINADIIFLFLILLLFAFGKVSDWHILLYAIFAFGCIVFAIYMDHKEYKINKEFENRNAVD